ncbi:hypothetical protein JCM10450v2_003409 [Rhodotorula kratochvilovae]
MGELSHGSNNDDPATDHDSPKNYVSRLNVDDYHTHSTGLIKAQYSLSNCALCGWQRRCIVDMAQHYDLPTQAVVPRAGITNKPEPGVLNLFDVFATLQKDDKDVFTLFQPLQVAAFGYPAAHPYRQQQYPPQHQHQQSYAPQQQLPPPPAPTPSPSSYFDFRAHFIDDAVLPHATLDDILTKYDLTGMEACCGDHRRGMEGGGLKLAEWALLSDALVEYGMERAGVRA